MEDHRGGVAVVLLPDHATMVWHHAREAFVANELYGKAKAPPVVKGAISTIEKLKVDVWAIWSRVFYNPDITQRKDNTLHILRLVLPDHGGADGQASDTEAEVRAIASVLRVAQKEADEWNMESVNIWNPDERTIKAARLLSADAQIVHREKDSIASLKWYGPVEDEASLTWVDIEKYTWC